MKSTSKKYILITSILLIIELLIAVYVRDTVIRPFFGDVLVVMLIFSFVRIFYHGKTKQLAIAVLLFSYTIEALQYFQLIEMLGLQNNNIATIILGATFDWLDLVAYTFGVLFSVLLDGKLNPKGSI